MTSKKDQYSRQAIQADASFAVSTIANFTTSNPSPMAVMSFTPYLALFLFESRKALANPSDLHLEPDIEALLRASRHSIKLFEDTHRGISGQRRVMRDEIIPSHKDYFLGNTWFPPAQFLETDLGLYILDQSLFSSTHAYTYLVGIPPEAIRNGTMSTIVNEASVAYGKTFVKLCSPMATSMPPGIKLLSNDALPMSSFKDKKSDKVYPRIFNGQATPDLNATLVCQLALVRFATDGYTALFPNEHTYSLFKISFITAYQVTSSLANLLAGDRAILTSNSIHFLEKITQSTSANTLLSSRGRALRNLLVHYKPLPNLDNELIDNNLLESTFRLADIPESISDYEGIVTRQLELLRDEMIKWCNLK